MVKILFIAGVMGRKNYVYRILPVLTSEDIEVVILAGNTGLPEVIDIFIHDGFKVYGVTGNLDDYSIIKELKRVNGYLDGRIIEYDGLMIGGMGVQVYNNYRNIVMDNRGIDILVSFYPPVKTGLQPGDLTHGSLYVDYVIEEKKPYKIFIGYPRVKPLRHDNLLFIGSLLHGYYTILDVRGDEYIIENKLIV